MDPDKMHRTTVNERKIEKVGNRKSRQFPAEAYLVT